jgi:hypothetical protein
MTKRSKVLLFGAALLLISYGCVAFGEFLYLLYRMHIHGDSLENMLRHAFAIGQLMASVLFFGLLFLASFVISRILESRFKTR